MPLLNFKNVTWTAIANAVGVEWATALLDWASRKPITINGALKTADFTDNFGSDSWTNIEGTAVGVSGGVMAYDANAGAGQSGEYRDFGSSLSDTFVSRFVWNIDNLSSGSNSANNQVCIAISSNTSDGGTSQDAVGILILADSGQVSFRYGIYDGQGLEVTTASTSINRSNLLGTGQYGVEIIRLAHRKFKFIIYADTEYTEVLDSYTLTHSADLDDLRYLKVTTIDEASADSPNDGSVDDWNIWDAETVVQNIPSQQTADAIWGDLTDQVIENFETYATQGAADTDWASTNTAKARVDISSDFGWCTIDTNAQDDTLSRDIGTANINSSKCLVRGKLNLTEFTQHTTGGNGHDCYIGLCNNLTITSAGGGRRFAGIGFRNNQTTDKWELGITHNNNTAWTKTIQIQGDTLADFDNYWFEIVILSSTLLKVTFFSDSNYSQVVDSATQTISGVTDLRYFLIGGYAQTTNGSETFNVDDLEFYNNITEVNPATLTDQVVPIRILDNTDLQRKTAETLEETAFTGWTQVGTACVVNNERIEFTSMPRNAEHRVWKAIGSTLSDTKWVSDFEVQIDSGTSQFGGVWIGFTDASTFIGTATMDFLGLNIHDTSGGTTFKMRLFEKDEGTLTAATNSTFTVTLGQKYYVRMIRVSATQTDCYVYSDKAKKHLIEKIPSLTTSSTVDTLTHAQVTSDDDSGAVNVSGHVDNLRVWSGITNPVTQETVTLQEIGDWADQSTADLDWVSSNVTYSRGNITNDNFDFDTKINVATNTSIVHDLQDELGSGVFVDNEKFYMRCKLVVPVQSHNGTGYEQGVFIGLSDSDESVDSVTSQKFLGVLYYHDNIDRRLQAIYALDESLQTNRTEGEVGSHPTNAVPASTTLYLVVRRTSKTTLDVLWYSDSDYSILVAEKIGLVVDSTITDLRYIAFRNLSPDSSETGGEIVTIDDIEFWNGIDNPNATGRKFVFTDNAFNTSTVEYSSKNKWYDPISGSGEWDVRIPSLTTGADTIIQMYYDYTPASSPSYTPELMPITVTADLDDDFTSSGSTSHSSDNTVVGGWRAADASEHYVDGTNDWLYWNISRGTNDAISNDRTTIDDNKWCLRIQTQWDAFVSNAFNEQRWGISDSDSTVAHNGTHKFIGFTTVFWDSVARTIVPTVGDSGTINQDTSEWTHDWDGDPRVAVDTDVFLECQRLSLTTYQITVSSTNEYKADIAHSGVLTCPALTGLRYIWFGNENAGSDDATMNSKTSKVEFYDGVNLLIGDREKSTYDPYYKAIYDLNGNALDSTVFGNDGTETATEYEEQNNNVGLLSNATTTLVNCGSDTSLDDLPTNGGLLLSAIINPKSDGEASLGHIARKRTTTGWYFYVESESAGFMKLALQVDFSSTDGTWKTTNAVIPINELSYVEVYYDASSVSNNPIFKINGIVYSVENGLLTESSTPVGAYSSDASDDFVIANATTSSVTFDGLINNVKVSNKQRSSSSSISQYNAEKENSDFISVGSEATQ